ncbi:MAG: PilZ domain-containing protein [Candidatus Scalinduaceae bacterium]
MYNGVEKRKYKRIEYKKTEKPFTVRFRARPDEYRKTVSDKWDMVAMKDLGAGGVFFFCNKILGVGALLDLKIGFSKSLLPINCVGTVTRIKAHQSSSMCGVSVAFAEIDEQEKEMINKTVEEGLRVG